MVTIAEPESDAEDNAIKVRYDENPQFLSAAIKAVIVYIMRRTCFLWLLLENVKNFTQAGKFVPKFYKKMRKLRQFHNFNTAV